MSAKVVVKEIAQADVRLRVPRHVSSNAQVLVDKPVQVAVVRYVGAVVSLVVKADANLYVKMTALWGVKDSVPMDALVVVRVDALAHVVATVATGAVAAAMVRLVYSNGEY